MNIETLVFQVSTRCPYNCPQCYMQKNCSEDLPLTTAVEAVDLALERGLKAIQITGGEPMLYPDLHGLIRYAHEKGLYVFLATSGYDHSFERYQSLKRSGLDILCISINDIDEYVNKLSRDAYAVSLSAIRDAIQAGLICLVNVVLSDDNIENLDLFAEYLRKKGIDGIEILRPVRSFDGKYIPSVSESTILKLDGIISRDPNFFRVENCFKEYWEYSLQKDFVCRDAGVSSAFINADGSVSPCSKLQQYRYTSIADMMENKHLWKGGCCK